MYIYNTSLPVARWWEAKPGRRAPTAVEAILIFVFFLFGAGLCALACLACLACSNRCVVSKRANSCLASTRESTETFWQNPDLASFHSVSPRQPPCLFCCAVAYFRRRPGRPAFFLSSCWISSPRAPLSLEKFLRLAMYVCGVASEGVVTACFFVLVCCCEFAACAHFMYPPAPICP